MIRNLSFLHEVLFLKAIYRNPVTCQNQAAVRIPQSCFTFPFTRIPYLVHFPGPESDLKEQKDQSREICDHLTVIIWQPKTKAT